MKTGRRIDEMGRRSRHSGGGRRQSRRITMGDIADRCGVSRITVSYALREDRKYVSQARIDEIKRVAAEMGYDMTLAHAARRLRYQNSDERVINHLVALFFPFDDFKHRYWSTIFGALQSHLQQSGYAVVCCTPGKREESTFPTFPSVFRRGDVDGVVMFPTEDIREEVIESLRKEPGFSRRPVVSLIESFADCMSVVIDDVQVGELAAGHLLDLGHRHLMAFRSRRFENDMVIDRLEGFTRAYRARGLDPDKYLHVADWLWDVPMDLSGDFRKRWKKWPMVTGVLCPNDGMGVALARALREEGVVIPQDLSFIGVDDCEQLPSVEHENIWTTVRLPLEKIGKEAADMLIRMIEEPESEVESKKLPVSLAVRHSTQAVQVAE